ncbi:MAG: DUF948 domain-containing protein [Oscillatoriophycideae cyanobacterium NC_groundwater_1537_Pr4_S-0.65um_50_18]|nr:DUF948 domain-containing protein [Oscillatoriophycideae cyanobacterium NC_groundwater_1537_Pr4_S-0.65um_50_18]
MDPLFWLGLSILLVAVSLTAVLVAALPAFRELARAARSAEKLFDTLSRELPPTLEAIRLTGLEITDLKEDVSEGVQSAGRVAQQVDQSLSGARKQAQQAQKNTRSLLAGVKAAWGSLNRPAVTPSHSGGRNAAAKPRLSANEIAVDSKNRLSASSSPILTQSYLGEGNSGEGDSEEDYLAETYPENLAPNLSHENTRNYEASDPSNPAAIAPSLSRSDRTGRADRTARNSD